MGDRGATGDLARKVIRETEANEGLQGLEGTREFKETEGRRTLVRPIVRVMSDPATNPISRRPLVGSGSGISNRALDKAHDDKDHEFRALVTNVVCGSAGLIFLGGMILLLIIIGPNGSLGYVWHPSRWSKDDRSRENDNPLRPYALQIMGLTFILPVVLVLGAVTNLSSEVVSALLGTMIAFIFGSCLQRRQDANSTPLPPPSRPDEQP
jgi:hypothetical protein